MLSVVNFEYDSSQMRSEQGFGSPDLELKMILKHPEGALSGTGFLCKGSKASQPLYNLHSSLGVNI